MNEHTQDMAHEAMEIRSREVFQSSVDRLDMRVQSRLTRARHAALAAAGTGHHRPWFFQGKIWTPAAGVTAAALLGAALWLGSPATNHGAVADGQPALEDLDIVASADEGSGDAIEMLQNDLDFYNFADAAANSGPSA